MQQPSNVNQEEIVIPKQTDRNINRKKSKKAKQKKLLIVGCLLILAMLAVLVVLLMIPTKTEDGASPSDSILSIFTPTPRIARGTSISGVPVGGMTEEQACEAVRASLKSDTIGKDMILTVRGRSLQLQADYVNAHWDVEAAVSSAMQGETKSVSLQLALNQQYVMDELQHFFDAMGGVYIPSGYWIEGGQHLMLNKGCAGLPVDLLVVYGKIVEGYEREQFLVALEDVSDVQSPAPLDLQAIFNEVALAPVNPRLDKTTMEVIPGTQGYGFDIDEVQQQLDQAKAGEQISVQMHFLSPAVSLDDVWFQDTLGYCKTPYTDNENRNENLRLACSKLNGLILQPGETLSYNQLLGKRTREAGYKPAPAYSGTDLVDEIGGGICQVSSTLYLSSLFAELKIVERKNHGFPANYIPMGLDATVNWGTTDLKIQNTYDFPVKILAEVADGYVKIRIMGVELRDYYVKIEYRVDDHPSYAAAYRCRYNLETDELISRELDHTSVYLEEVWCWPGFAENATDDPIEEAES